MTNLGPAELRSIVSHSLRSSAEAGLGFRELCRSVKFDVFRDRLNGVFYPARVTPVGGAVQQLPSSRLSAACLRHLTLGFVCFGAKTSVDPGALGSYHVNVPVAGAVESHCGRQQMMAVPGRAAVFTPREHTFLPVWGDDAAGWCWPSVTITRRRCARRGPWRGRGR